jgi:hypothetical protein
MSTCALSLVLGFDRIEVSGSFGPCGSVMVLPGNQKVARGLQSNFSAALALAAATRYIADRQAFH